LNIKYECDTKKLKEEGDQLYKKLTFVKSENKFLKKDFNDQNESKQKILINSKILNLSLRKSFYTLTAETQESVILNNTSHYDYEEEYQSIVDFSKEMIIKYFLILKCF